MAENKLNETSFETEVLKNEGTVLVDFYADWCGPCKMVAPIVAEIAEERADITVGKINVDAEEALAAEFGVFSIPTLVVMKDGKIQQVDTPQNLYDKPNRVFVAGFIGTPQMNFIEANLTKEGSDVYVEFQGNKMKLPSEKANARQKASYREISAVTDLEGLISRDALSVSPIWRSGVSARKISR